MPHSILGAIVAAITFMHPILAIFRPAVDHPKRVYFKWTHTLIGGFAFAVASEWNWKKKKLRETDFHFLSQTVAAVFTGMDLVTMQMPRWSFMILFGFYGLFLGVSAILTVS
jgi:hypothetical protein